MEDHEFCDSCPGCRPALMTPDGKIIPNDDPTMMKINHIWDEETTFAQRRAFIEVTLKNSKNTHDLALASQVIEKFQKEMS